MKLLQQQIVIVLMIDDITKREEYRESFWNSKMIKMLTCALNGKLNLEL